MELYDEELDTETYRVGIHTYPHLEPVMSGPGPMIKNIEKVSRKILRDNKLLVTLGGEHSITYGVTKALKEKYPKLSVLQFDAHADLRNSYQETKYNHACAMRRVSEIAPSVQLGIRSITLEETRFIKKNKKKINIVYAKELQEDFHCYKNAVSYLSEDVYVTIDLDFFDPSVMPAVGTPEPGGFGWYEVLKILKYVCKSKRVVGFDVMELSPHFGNVAPDFFAAKLVYKFLGYIFHSGKYEKPEGGS